MSKEWVEFRWTDLDTNGQEFLVAALNHTWMCQYPSVFPIFEIEIDHRAFTEEPPVVCDPYAELQGDRLALVGMTDFHGYGDSITLSIKDFTGRYRIIEREERKVKSTQNELDELLDLMENLLATTEPYRKLFSQPTNDIWAKASARCADLRKGES